jgi:hypothetical protein
MSKVIDITPYGFNGTVSLNDPTPKVVKLFNEFKKKNKDPVEAEIFFLSKIIIDAPFDVNMETLENLPMSLINHLAVEGFSMMLPLEQNSQKKFLEFMKEEENPENQK